MNNKEIAEKIANDLIRLGNDVHFNQLFFKYVGEHFSDENENHNKISKIVDEQISVCEFCGVVSEYPLENNLCDDCNVEEEIDEEDEEYI